MSGAAAAGAAGAGAGAAADVAGTAAGSAAVGAAGAAAAGAAPSFSMARLAPTSTVAPSAARISPSVPAAGAGTSSVTLSVSSSTTGSSAATASPVVLIQRATVASATDSPRVGTVISIAITASSPRVRGGRLPPGFILGDPDGRPALSVLVVLPRSSPSLSSSASPPLSGRAPHSPGPPARCCAATAIRWQAMPPPRGRHNQGAPARIRLPASPLR